MTAGGSGASLAEDYLLRAGQFTIEPAEYHAALAEAINKLAPSANATATTPSTYARWWAPRPST
ncbi:MAG TPA: hypothetical protein VFC00_12360, partial [Micromonosporaceae bacterium]|nr:hypothetical protein [Micromonosporaceae bacterium]